MGVSALGGAPMPHNSYTHKHCHIMLNISQKCYRICCTSFKQQLTHACLPPHSWAIGMERASSQALYYVVFIHCTRHAWSTDDTQKISKPTIATIVTSSTHKYCIKEYDINWSTCSCIWADWLAELPIVGQTQHELIELHRHTFFVWPC